MNEQPTIVILGASRARQTLATSVLQGVATVKTDRSALAALPPRGLRIALVDLAVPDLEDALRVLEEVRATMPNVQLVALAASKDPDLILRAMRAGAREFALLDDSGDLAGVVSALVRRAAAEEPGGTIVSVFPAKGGMGATTLATNLGGSLAGEGHRVVIVDFERQPGDVLAFLDMTAGYTIADVLKNFHRLDRELLLSSLARHDSGLFVLPQPDPLDDMEAATAAQIPPLLQFLARHFDYVVCDGVRGFDEVSVAVLDASSRVELVLSQEIPALKNAKHCLDVFNRLGYDDDKVSLVVNRFDKSAAINLAAIGENLGRDVKTTLANDYRAAVSAVNRGVLLGESAPRSKLTQDIARMAALVSGAPPKPRRGLFGALFGRGGQRPDAGDETERAKRNTPNEGTSDEPGRAPETT